MDDTIAGSKVNWSRCRMVHLTGWPISLERKVPEASKLVSRLRMPQAIMPTSFKVKRSNLITAETISVSYLPKGRLRNFKSGTSPIEHAQYQLPRSAINAYVVGFLHAGGGISCRPQLVNGKSN